MNAVRHDNNAQSFLDDPSKIDLTQAFLDAVAASTRLAASKNFADIYHCTNSNESGSNGAAVMADFGN